VYLQSFNAHHITKVLRLSEGDTLHVFNEQYGEWEAKITCLKKCEVICQTLIAKTKKEVGPAVACALINPNRFFIFLEKVTELGATEIIPIITQYTQHKIFNNEKAEKIIIQASEQSKRFSVPTLKKTVKLEEFLQDFDCNGKILVGNEKCSGKRLNDILEEKCVFLIGPEGGFSSHECALFEKYDFVKTFNFGLNILRSETAAIAFVSAWCNKFIQ
jgi:16S rRNA (uracil1498-N3)-methyltransferase